MLSQWLWEGEPPSEPLGWNPVRIFDFEWKMFFLSSVESRKLTLL